MTRYEVVIVGGGAAGLSAALVLGRVRRSVLVVDSGRPRNTPASAVHGFLTRDGIPPARLLERGRQDLSGYPSVQVGTGTVGSAHRGEDEFVVSLGDGTHHRARRLLLATGVTDQLPDVDGLAGLWGNGVFHCPYCHGWEVRDQPLAVLGGTPDAAQLAVYLTRLSADVVLCTNGPHALDAALQHVLAANGVPVREEPIARLQGTPGRMEQVVFATGQILARAAMFLRPHIQQHSDLATQLGCTLLDDGRVQVDQTGATTVTGVYAAGDLARTRELLLPAGKVITAAGAAAQTAVTIDRDLVLADITAGIPLTYHRNPAVGQGNDAAPEVTTGH